MAWAIDLKREESKRAFGDKGQSLHWWWGFRDPHPSLSLKKTEGVDRGRVANATADIVNDYFNVLEEILDDNSLKARPHLIFNCDESAIILNKASKKVLVPRKSKHVHSILNATTQHVPVLCCVSASGSALPLLIVFSKGLPAGRNFHKDGPINCAYSSSASGFVDRTIYTEWFTKVCPIQTPSTIAARWCICTS